MAYRLLAWAGVTRVKACSRCGVVLPLHRFPTKHGKPTAQCYPCKRIGCKESRKRRMQNPATLEKERKRQREKWHNRAKISDYEKENRSRIRREYNERYPEKAAAQDAATSLLPKTRLKKHHWSYMECHKLSVIYMSIKDHALLHTLIEYDQDNRLYRDKETGELLDSPEAHIKILARAKKK